MSFSPQHIIRNLELGDLMRIGLVPDVPRGSPRSKCYLTTCTGGKRESLSIRPLTNFGEGACSIRPGESQTVIMAEKQHAKVLRHRNHDLSALLHL